MIEALWYKFSNLFNDLTNSLYSQVYSTLEFYLPKFLWALLIIWIWILISIWIYKLIIYLFKKFKIIALIDKLNIQVEEKEKTSIKHIQCFV